MPFEGVGVQVVVDAVVTAVMVDVALVVTVALVVSLCSLSFVLQLLVIE